jgi:hypothetical protein
MAASPSSSLTAARPRGGRAALILAAAVAVATAVNAVVATVAIAAGAPSSYGPLTLPAYTLFTAIGVALGWVGWRLVQRHSAHARRTLAILVPVVVVVSFVPDVLLAVVGFIPGTTPGAALALGIMHVVVAAVAVPAYAVASPVAR